MYRELISASLTQKDVKFLEKLPTQLLEPKDLEVRDWIVQYYNTHGVCPEVERFKKEKDYGHYWTASLNATPLADLFKQTVNALNFSFLSKAVSSVSEDFYDKKPFDYDGIQDVINKLTPTNGMRHEARDIFSDNIDALFEGNNSLRLPFGIPNLDESIGGMKVGDYAIIVAPTGVGKTTFLCFHAVRVARGGGKVLFISREITREALREKISAIIGNFNVKLFEGITDVDLRKLAIKKEKVKEEFESIKTISGGEIHIPEESVFTTDDVEAMVKRELSETGRGYDLIAVDGIYSMSQNGNGFVGGDWASMRTTSIKLMDIAKTQRLGTRVLASTQIKPECAEKLSFTSSDIAYCKAIEQDADIVFGIAKGCAAVRSLEKTQKIWSIGMIKNRNGPMSFYDSEMMVDFETSSLLPGNTNFTDDLSNDPLCIIRRQVLDANVIT